MHQISGWAVLAAASLGLLALARAPLRLLQGGYSWAMAAGRPLPDLNMALSTYEAWLAPLERWLFWYPWLPPLLAAVAICLRARPAWPELPASLPRWQIALACGALALVLAAGAHARLAPLWDFERAIDLDIDYDEAVYLASARAWGQGAVPYRDFWLSHPPTGIALLRTTALAESGMQALALGRRLTAGLDLLAGLLMLWAGFELGGLGCGLLAAGLYLLDGQLGRNSTHLWLESGVNLWSLAALGCLLRGLRRDQPGWLAGAGALAVLAASTKYTGAALLLAGAIGLMLARRWRALGWLLAGAAGLGLPYAAAWLFVSGDASLRQTLVAQLLRPARLIYVPDRVVLAFNQPASLPVVLLGGLGAAFVCLRRQLLQVGWGIALLWLALTLAALAGSGSFYRHYLTQLIAPLALLGGATLAGWPERRRWWLASAALLALAVLPFFMLQQRAVASDPPRQRWRSSAAGIAALLPPDTPLLALDPVYNLLCDRPFMRAGDGRLLIDSFLHLPNLRAELGRRSWLELWERLARGRELAGGSPRDPLAELIEAAPATAFYQARMPGTDEQRAALAARYRRVPLGVGRLYLPTQHAHQLVSAELALRGVEVDTALARAAPLQVTLLWQAAGPNPRQPMISLQLIDASVHKWGQIDKLVGPRDAPPQDWRPGEIYVDSFAVPVDPSTPPGSYDLLVTIYDPATGQPWPLSSVDGQPIGGSVVVERIEVRP